MQVGDCSAFVRVCVCACVRVYMCAWIVDETLRGWCPRCKASKRTSIICIGVARYYYAKLLFVPCCCNVHSLSLFASVWTWLQDGGACLL